MRNMSLIKYNSSLHRPAWKRLQREKLMKGEEDMTDDERSQVGDYDLWVS